MSEKAIKLFHSALKKFHKESGIPINIIKVIVEPNLKEETAIYLGMDGNPTHKIPVRENEIIYRLGFLETESNAFGEARLWVNEHEFGIRA